DACGPAAAPARTRVLRSSTFPRDRSAAGAGWAGGRITGLSAALTAQFTERTSVTEAILVAVAWPYANGPVHAGQFGGAYLPADIFARYHRTAGNRVLMVSGSDMHGTPITVRAEREGRAPESVAAEFHASFLETWERMGISFDLFTSTGTENHARVSQDVFLKLLENGYLY